MISRLKSTLLAFAGRLLRMDDQPLPTIISNDCFGGEVYQAFHREYTTPFVGLMIQDACYLRMLEDLETLMQQELVFVTRSGYARINDMLCKRRFPVAMLGSKVEIQFLHYASDTEARQAWRRRSKRINWQHLLVKFDFTAQTDAGDLARFKALPFERKLLIGSTQSVAPVFTRLADHTLVADLPVYSTDSTVFFRRSLKFIDLKEWVMHNRLTKPGLLDRILLPRILRNHWRTR